MMPRYLLKAGPPNANGADLVDTGVSANSKIEMRQWIEEHGRRRGHDWQVGFLFKFRDSDQVYQWVVTKTGDLAQP